MSSGQPASFADWESARRRNASAKNAENVAKLAEQAGYDPSATAFVVPANTNDDSDDFIRSVGFKRGVVGLVIIDLLCVIFRILLLIHDTKPKVDLKGNPGADPTALRIMSMFTTNGHRAVVALSYTVWLLSFAEHTVYMANSLKQRAMSYLRLLDAVVVLGHGGLLVLAPSPLWRFIVLVRFVRVFELLDALEVELRARTLSARVKIAEAQQDMAELRAQVAQGRLKWSSESDARQKTEELMGMLKEENETLREALLVAAQEMAELTGEAAGGDSGEATAQSAASQQQVDGKGGYTTLHSSGAVPGDSSQVHPRGSGGARSGHGVKQAHKQQGSVVSDSTPSETERGAAGSVAGTSISAGSASRTGASGKARRRVILTADGTTAVVTTVRR